MTTLADFSSFLGTTWFILLIAALGACTFMAWKLGWIKFGKK